MLAVGIDGFRARWLAVALRDGAFAGARVCETLATALAGFPDAAAFGVDVPIGPPERGVRPADALAREYVGPRRASVFPTPPRAVVDAAVDHADAVALCRARDAPGVSRQAFGLLPKVREAAGLAERDERVWEVHPEVSFCALNGGRPLAQAKRTWAGQAARRELLARAGIEIPAELGAAGACPPDDVLDAAAAAWSAARIARGEGESLPPGASRIGAIWR